MSIIRRRDKFGRDIIVGAGLVIRNKDNVVVIKTKCKDGQERYAVKVMIATLPYKEKKEAKTKYQRKLVTIYAFEHNRVCADIVKSLQSGDDVFFFGKIDNREFETTNGTIMKSFQINLEYITVYGRYSKSVKQEIPDTDTAENTEEENTETENTEEKSTEEENNEEEFTDEEYPF